MARWTYHAKIALFLGVLIFQFSCLLTSDLCRLEPQNCRGGVGALCNGDKDCGGGLFCCLEKSNCGGGMCTIACEVDKDCPSDMLCEHKKCFYRCKRDEDCAPKMKCEHNNTICEYP